MGSTIVADINHLNGELISTRSWCIRATWATIKVMHVKSFFLRASSLNRHPHDVLARVTDDTVSVFPPLYEVVECDERQSEAFVS